MNMRLSFCFIRRTLILAIALAMSLSASLASAQVSPSEIQNPDLKALEETYFQQLKILNQSIAKTKFPFPFYLSRFVGLDPAQQAEADSRGLEFVRFQDRVIFKVTGNYNAAYDTVRVTQNERAAGTFRTIVLPILDQVTAVLPHDLACDGIGFEISHHARTRDRSYDYEGKEILVVVFDRDDAWALSHVSTDSARQEILNRSKVYVSGTDFGLSLTERDPLNVQALPRSVPTKLDATSTARSSTAASHSSLLKSNRLLSSVSPPVAAPIDPAPARANPVVPSPKAADPTPLDPPPAPADAERLNEKHQPQLAALAKEGLTWLIHQKLKS